MSRQTSSRFLFPFFGFILTALFAVPAYSALISINNQQFDDNGDTTFDLATKLEWFDVSTTKNRSFNDVYFDLTHEGGTFNPADGWRYAHANELQDLISRVFAPGYTTGHLEIPGQDEAVANFVNLFGDTWTDLVGASIKITRDLDASFSVGRTDGIFATEESGTTKVGGFADINDSQFIIYGLNDGDVDRFDLTDSITISIVQSDEFSDYESYSDSQLGSWIVRDTVTVPEPATAILLLLGGLGLFLRRTIFN